MSSITERKGTVRLSIDYFQSMKENLNLGLTKTNPAIQNLWVYADEDRKGRKAYVVNKSQLYTLFFMRTLFIRTLRLRFDQKFKKMYGMT